MAAEVAPHLHADHHFVLQEASPSVTNQDSLQAPEDEADHPQGNAVRRQVLGKNQNFFARSNMF
jgi:hypothetical protein